MSSVLNESMSGAGTDVCDGKLQMLYLLVQLKLKKVNQEPQNVMTSGHQISTRLACQLSYKSARKVPAVVRIPIPIAEPSPIVCIQGVSAVWQSFPGLCIPGIWLDSVKAKGALIRIITIDGRSTATAETQRIR